jgi:hypothetical protein
VCAIHVGCFSARLQRGFRPGDHRSGIVEVFIQKATVGCNIGRLRWDVTAGGGSGKPQSELPFSEIRKYVPGTLQWETTMGSNGGRPGPFALPTLELDAYTCGATMVSYAGNCNGKP